MEDQTHYFTTQNFFTLINFFAVTLAMFFHNIQEKPVDENCSVYIEEILHVKDYLNFLQIPNSSIISRAIYRNATVKPNSTCEFTYANKKIDKTLVVFHPILYNYSFSLYHLKNFFYCNYYSYVSDLDIYYSLGRIENRNTSKKVIGHYQHLVAGNSDLSYKYGDIVIGTIARLNQFPFYYLNISYIQVPFAKYIPTYKLVLEARGITNPKFIVANKEESVFAENLYTIIPDLSYGENIFFHHCFEGDPMQSLGKLLLRYYKITEIAKDYVLYNRFRNSCRYINNFNQIKNAITNSYPNINFSVFYGHFEKLKDCVIQYARIKWGFMINGSNTMNQPNS